MGHQVGDSVLQEVTRRISAFSDDNKIGRWTGDEFLVALPYSDAPTAKAIASAIITSISQAISVNNNSVHLGATVGIAMCPEHSTEATELIQFADLVMSEQKVTPDRTPDFSANGINWSGPIKRPSKSQRNSASNAQDEVSFAETMGW